MKTENKIPTLEPGLSDELHFGKVKWQTSFPGQSHLFHINKLEDFRDKMNFPLPPHRKVVHDLIFIIAGKSTRYKGLNEYSFGAKQFFFLPRLQITKHKSMSEDVKGYFIHFSPDLFAEYNHDLSSFSFLKFLGHPVVTIPDDILPFLLSLFQRMEQLYINMRKDDLDLVTQYLFTLLKEVDRHVIEVAPKTTPSTAARLTEKYKNALTRHIYEIQTVKEYAEQLYVTPNHLNKCVKSTINKTAQVLLNEMLVLEAKSLLKYSGLSISEVAERLGNRTPTNFCRFFKNQTGMTPKQHSKTLSLIHISEPTRPY